MEKCIRNCLKIGRPTFAMKLCRSVNTDLTNEFLDHFLLPSEIIDNRKVKLEGEFVNYNCPVY